MQRCGDEHLTVRICDVEKHCSERIGMLFVDSLDAVCCSKRQEAVTLATMTQDSIFPKHCCMDECYFQETCMAFKMLQAVTRGLRRKCDGWRPRGSGGR